MINKKAILVTALYFVVFLSLIIAGSIFNSPSLLGFTFVYVIIGGLVTRKILETLLNSNNNNYEQH